MFARTLLILIGFTGGALAQQPLSPLERQKVLRDLANQKAESDTREALGVAEKLARTHPDKAIRDLKVLARNLDLRTDIDSSKREELIALVNKTVANLERGSAAIKEPVLDPKLMARKEENKKTLAKFEAEAKEVSEAIAKIAREAEANRPREAQRLTAELAQKYPNNPAVIALLSNGNMTDKIAYSRLLAQEQSDRFVLAMNDVARSALPARGDIEFPKDWKEKTERRRKLEPALYGPEEMKILETLEKPVNLKLKDAPFEESIQSLSTAMNLPIYLDKKSLEDLAVDLKSPVSVPANVTTGRTALRAMLQSVGLSFVIKDSVLQVVSVEKARANYVTRAYDVSDLVRTGGPFNSPVLWGPFLDYQQTQQNAQVLIDLITKSIDPLVWQLQGGAAASVTFHYPSMSMIIRAPSEVHATLGKSLKR